MDRSRHPWVLADWTESGHLTQRQPIRRLGSVLEACVLARIHLCPRPLFSDYLGQLVHPP